MILQVEGLVVGYGASVVVHGISFHVGEGEIASLVGRNGAGKTTTIRGLMGLVRPRAGEVHLRGRAIAGLAPYEIARLGVGYVPDDRRIFPDLTVEEHLRLAARLASGGRGRWTLERVYDLFPTLHGLRASRGDHLSGGEQKMLAIGRALIRDPDLILLDDPAEGLAPLVVRRLAEILREIRKTGVSILLADQNLRFCRQVADRAYVMEKGTIVAQGPMAAIWEDQELIARHLAV
ncbi:MAG: ABC transporter ATP-binding protein [Armatimonadota bacterium]|nr:ABC transporter ATP-binding protein [Armatimonadota bacterium]MDR7485756.1 ABC transporter ATP-binding protein [Armatimonadota bacterium]MDR7534098.1 ABC transporter ATP-binding protein [Armatimonadota bacterium]MDR7537565.1 ABC transporter ATP-binding protein [Armatimonadota bacterium]